MLRTIKAVLKPVARPILRTLGKNWDCPLCGHHGPFRPIRVGFTTRKYVFCPGCGSRERHRLQKLVLDRVVPGLDLGRMAVLHFAPEAFFTAYFKPKAARYVTADIDPQGVDVAADLRALPFAGGTFDLVYASHVLEHVDDDRAALAEIRRVLRPGGLAVLPVPIVQEKTVEYPEPNPHEVYHVRAPGPDYYDRYREFFGRVDLYRSADFDPRYQVYIHEDRTVYPTAACPRRTPTAGKRHEDVVPVCWVGPPG